MKILALRGANLASLTEFDLDLEKPPLGAAGLFAITGPTGAGKSSILDALCLALFDRTPRLAERGGPFIGREDEDPRLKLRSHDVRGILARGRAEGFCEVDFRGRDEQRYRARWEVRRARRRTDGAFQDQELSLVDLATGATLGTTRTETLAEIETRLGLSFAQFRRSVLLAQGEFAAFLKADGRERAELLERMTGTAVYGQISRLAHERFRTCREGLDATEKRLGDLHLMPADQRHQLATERDDTEGRQEALRRQITGLEETLRWYREAEKLEQEEVEAGTRLQEAETGWTALQPVMAELARLEAAEPLRGRLEALDRLTTEAARTKNEYQVAVTAHENASRDLQAAKDEHDRADREASEAAERHQALQPDLQRAQSLDRQVEDRSAAARQAAEKAHLSAEAEAQAAKRRSDLETELSTGAAAEASLVAELSRSLEVEPVAREWSRWEVELGRFTALDKAEPEAAALQKTYRDALDAVQAAARKAEAELASAEEPMELARTAAEAAQHAAAEHPLAELQASQELLVGRRDTLQRMLEAAGRASQASTRETTHRNEEAEARGKAEAGAEARQGLLRRIGEVRSARAEARRNLERARSAQDLSARRGELRPGEPCPLCGSQDHPYRHAEKTLDAMVAELERRVAELEEDLRAQERADAEKEADSRAAEERAKRAAALAEQARAERKDLKGQFDRLALELGSGGLPEDPADPALRPTLQVHLTRVDEELEAVRARQKEAARLQDAARTAEAEIKRRQADLDLAREAHKRAEQSAQELAPKIRVADHERERVAQDRSRILEGLAQAFAPWGAWRDELTASPEAFRRNAAARVEERRRLEVGLTKARERAVGLKIELEAAVQRHLERQDRMRAELDQQREREREVEALVRERRLVLDGRAVEEVAEESRTRFQATRTRADQARERLHAAERSRDVRRSEEENSGRAAEYAENHLGEAARELEARLATQGLDVAALRSLIGPAGAGSIQERRTVVDGTRRRLDEARAQLDDRRARLARHRAAGAPELPRDHAQTRRDTAVEDLRTTDGRLAELRAKLAVDDDTRHRAGELTRDLGNQRRAAETWASLDELIGSHDGWKLRAFAQSLTLDALLAEANLRLNELSHRYRLVRVPGQDMELQVVDRDMGDEVRPVGSLSGGESFLVSLAMALALSSLSAHSTRIESLFIDEGFGTLDPNTLDTALQALDTLQAAGCQVGVISHVAGLAERIGTLVEVEPRGGGRSVVRVRGLA